MYLKKLSIVAAVAAMTLGVVACGSNNAESVAEATVEASVEATAEVSEVAEVAAEATEEVVAETTEEAAPAITVSENIKGMYFSTTRALEVAEGEENVDNYVKVNLKDEDAFNAEDVTFVSSNPEVVTIEFDKQVSYYYLYFKLTGVSAGETEIYAVSADGAVESEHKKVTVVPSKENVAKEDVETSNNNA